MTRREPNARLDAFLDRYSPEVAGLARDVLARMRELLPGAVEMVYDNYNALVVGFGPSERASEAVFSVALYPRYLNLFFLRGAGLPDPHRLLKGQGKQVRSIRIDTAETLDEPAVRELMARALDRAEVPIDAGARGRIVIKAVSENRRPRRPK